MCTFMGKNDRKNRTEELERRLIKLLEEDFPAAYKSDNRSDALQRIKEEEALIKITLSALRLRQGEDRLTNNLLITLIASGNLIFGTLLGYFIRHI